MVKKISLLVILISTFVLSFGQQKVFQSRGVPANSNATAEYRQPDGSVLTISMNGDAVVNWATTPDGYTLLLNQKDGFEYAIKDDKDNLVLSGILAHNPGQRTVQELQFINVVSKDLRYSKEQVSIKLQTHEFFAAKANNLPKAFPTTGNRKIVVILANFSNTTTTYTQTNFDNLLNQSNYNGIGSFKDFYFQNSWGQLTITSTVTQWVKVPNTHDYYGPDAKWGEFAYESVKAADPYVDYSQFDNDGDGIVDGVAIIHQGLGQEESGSTKDIWSHSWQLSSAGYTTTQRTFDGVKVDAYTTQPEKQGSGMMQIGVLCHEVGHNLGAPDYYDTDYSTSGQYDGTGAWDLMASGSWNGSPSGSKPAYHNAYTKCYVYGWATPTTISTAGTYTIQNAESNKSIYRVNTATTNEYFLLENRQQTSFDAALPGHGMIVYHVDGSYISQYMSSNKINCTSHQGMYVVAANATSANGVPGSNALNSAAVPWPGTGSKTQFTDATTPNMKSWAGTASNKPITSITETSGVISFVFMGGTTNPTAPTATTNAATSVAQNSAVLNATVNNNNATSTTVTFEYGTTTSYGNTVNASPNSVTGNTNTSVSATITSLQANTTYHFRVKAVNSVGTTYGSDVTFTTPAAPTAVNLPYTENFNSSTMPTGWTTSNTGTSITERWSVSNTANAGGTAYEMKCSYQNVNPGTTMLISPALNTNGISNVVLNAKYMFDDYGAGATIKIQKSNDKVNWTDVSGWSLTSSSNTNKSGTISVNVPANNSVTYIAFVVTGNLYQIDYFYIDNVAFTTSVAATVPTVTTTAASSITSSSVVTGGNVTSDGGATVTERGVCYSTSQNPTTSNSKVTSGTGTGSFTCNVSGLQANTTYYVRAYAINSAGTAYGSQISFTTSSATVTYCASKGNSVTYEWIDYFKLGTLTNTTAANAGYGDFTSMTPPSLGRGTTQTVYFSAGFKSTAYTEYFKVYIDYNKNGVFTDAGELVASYSSNSSGTLSKTFTVPSDAPLGTTRLRIVMSDNSSTTSCGSYSYGETEDYTINISTSSSAPILLTSINVESEHQSPEYLTIYPVPANEFITINVNNNDLVNAKATIYNIKGQKVAEYVILSNNQEINISELPAGTYNMIFFDGQKEFNKNFIKY